MWTLALTTAIIYFHMSTSRRQLSYQQTAVARLLVPGGPQVKSWERWLHYVDYECMWEASVLTPEAVLLTLIIMITFLTLTCEWNESKDSAVKGTLTFFSRHRHEAHPLLWLLSAKVIGFLLKRSQMVNTTNRIWNDDTKMFEIVDQLRILNELNQNLCTKVLKWMSNI